MHCGRGVFKCQASCYKNFMQLNQTDVEALLSIAILAGERILEVYDGDVQVELKEDESPLTIADKKSHEVIETGLKKYFPDLPILSEEGEQFDYSTRSKWDLYWLVDPLDGTKEFIKKNGEFTVNIALMKEHRPIWGVVYTPVSKECFWGGKEYGAYYAKGEEDVVQLNGQMKKDSVFRFCMSRSHSNQESQNLINAISEKYNESENVKIGSSLKFCRLATGQIDFYPRLGPLREWDMAAGQAVLEGSGGEVYTFEGFKDIPYGKDDLVQPWFCGQRNGIDLREILSNL